MVDVKWIKLATALPDNRKMKQIRRLPDGDTIALMWVYLLCLAGETNDAGMIYFTRDVPYTDEMLASQFDMDINTVRLGLSTYQKFGMIQIVDDIICLTAWEKWQAEDKMSDMREKNRKRVARYREKQRLLASSVTCNEESNVTVTDGNAIDIDKDKEIDIDKERGERETDAAASDEATTSPAKNDTGNKTRKDKPVKHRHGEYQNVLLTEEELTRLQAEFPDWQERIDNLSRYIASKGAKYKSHYATIRNWARKDAEDARAAPDKAAMPAQQAPPQNNPFLAYVRDHGGGDGQ